MNNINQKIAFTEEVDTTIAGILTKYGFNETPDEAFKKLVSGKLPQKTVIIELTRDFLSNKKTQENSISFLQTQFETTKETAEKIFLEIKEKIVPFGQKIETSPKNNLEIDKIEKKDIVAIKIKPTIEAEKTFKKPGKELTSTPKKTKNISTEERKDESLNPQQIKKSDKYREIIN